MGTISKLFSCADSGQVIRLNLRGDEKYKTCPGSCLAVILYGMIAVFALHEIQDHVNLSKGPFVSNYKVFDTRESSTDVRSKKGQFGFGLKDLESLNYFDLLENDGTEVIGGRFGSLEAF